MSHSSTHARSTAFFPNSITFTALVILATCSLLSGLFLPTLASAQQPSATEVGKYLVVGMREGGSDAFNISSSNELGADRSFLSGADPNTYSVFAERWDDAGADTNFDNPPSTEEPDSFQTTNDGHDTPPGAAPVFQGIDYSGNVALTSGSGTFAMGDIQVFADLGVQAANTSPVQSVSNADYFPNLQTTANDGATAGNEANGDLDDPSAPGTTDGGTHNNDGLEGDVDLSQLLTDLGLWRTFIQNLDEGTDPLCEITSDIISQNAKDGSGPLEVNYDSCDKNGDGIAVIDINRSGNDFKVDTSDWIIDGSGNVLFIFRIRGNANMLMPNAAILLGDGGIGGGSMSTPVSKIGAIFVKAHPFEEGTSSSDQVFNGSNVILNGIALWDLVEVGTGQASDTELIINNGQGCAQFISTKVNFQDVRWNRCTLAASVSLTPAINIVKTVMPSGGTCGFGGVGDDVDVLTLATVPADVEYCYVVTNPGTGPALNVVVTDDNGTPGNTADDFLVTLTTGLSTIDASGIDNDLVAGGTATGQSIPITITTTPVTNIAEVTADGGLMDDDPAMVLDPAPAINIVKTIMPSGGTCGFGGVGDDVDVLAITPGDDVEYCYVVTNPGTAPALNVVVIDDAGTPGVPGDDFEVVLTGLTDEDTDTDLDDLAAGATATGQSTTTIPPVSPITIPTPPVTNIATVTADGGLTDDDPAMVIGINPGDLNFCNKGPVKRILNTTTGRFPGITGVDNVVRTDLGESITAAINAAADFNADGYIIIGVITNGTGKRGGSTIQNVAIDRVFPLPFGLIGCSVTLIDPNALDAIPTGHITALTSAPDLGPPAMSKRTDDNGIFVFDLHTTGSNVAGWRVEGDKRTLENVFNNENGGVGVWATGDFNVFKNGRTLDNGQEGLIIEGDANQINKWISKGNGSDGVAITGDLNLVERSTIGDRKNFNGGGGIVTIGAGNVIYKNRVEGTGGNGIEASGGTAVSPNSIAENRVGSRNAPSGGHGIFVHSSVGNSGLTPVEIYKNKVSYSAETGVLVDSSATAQEITGNRSERNGGCDFKVSPGNLDGGNNKGTRERFSFGPAGGESCDTGGNSGSAGGGARAPEASIRETIDRNNCTTVCPVILDGSRSSGQIDTYEFTVVDKFTGATIIGPITQATATLAVSLAPSEYVVTLTVTGPTGEDTETRRITVRS